MQDEVDPLRFFPLRSLFNTSLYGRLVRKLDDATAERVDKMRERFQTVLIPAQVTKTEDRATVAIIFERVNRQGVELNTFQLLTAWTWSEDFQLQKAFDELSADISSFGFEEIGADTNLLLRCCSAILTGDASPNELMSLNGAQVRENFELISNGIKYAIDFVKSHFQVAKLSNLPYSTQLVPLSVFFAASGNSERSYTDDQGRSIRRWFWRSSFSRRYSSGVIRNLNHDIAEMMKLRDGKENDLGSFPPELSSRFFTASEFGVTSVNTKTFILMLSSQNPLSFSSGAPIDLREKLKDANRTEFHHLMPRAFIKKSGQNENLVNVLANFAFLSRADNRLLGGDAPSVYLDKMAENRGEILSRSLVPDSLFNDEISRFIRERATMLTNYACELCEIDRADQELSNLFLELSDVNFSDSIRKTLAASLRQVKDRPQQLSAEEGQE